MSKNVTNNQPLQVVPDISPHVEAVPRELQKVPRWLLWRPQLEGDKVKKVPHSAVTGFKCDPTNPENWATFQQAVARYTAESHRGWGGLGLAMSDDGLNGVDLDGCRNPETGVVAPWAKAVVERLGGYAEISPSGRGLHIFIRGKLPWAGKNRKPVEVYSNAHYLTVTGHVFQGHNHVVENQAGLDWLAENLSLISLAAEISQGQHGVLTQRLFNGDSSGYKSQSEADLGLCKDLARIAGHDPAKVDFLFRLSGLYRLTKWDVKHSGNGQTYGQMTVTRALAGPGNTDPHPRGGAFTVTALANIPKEATQFLVNPYLPRGELTLFEGNPGEGKTWAWMALAAGLTGSKVCPVPYDYTAPKNAKVVILTAEDSLSKTVRGRLEELGADLQRIFVFTSPDGTQPTAADLNAVVPIIEELRPDLVVIDPITLYATTDKDFDGDKAVAVRRLLNNLIAKARRLNFALLATRHFRKAGGKAIHCGLGSIDFAASARSILSFGRNAETGVRLVVHSKSTLASEGPALEYRLDPNAWSCFQWVKVIEGVNPDEITGTMEATGGSKLGEAKEFLREVLRGSPMPAKEVLKAAKDAGISEMTLRRARKELNVIFRRVGFGSAVNWELPKT